MKEVKKEKLIEKYIIKQRSTIEIAKEFGVDRNTINYYLKKFNIPLRTYEEASQLVFEKGKVTSEDQKRYSAMSSGFLGHKHSADSIKKMSDANSGENHPQFKNWASLEPYGIGFNGEIKEEIRVRDGYTCQGCPCTQEQLGYKLCIHHIDYDKLNNSKDNLISLCKSCHAKTNFGRKDWEMYFKKKIGECE